MLKEHKPAFIASLLLICFLTLSIWLVKQYVSNEKERDFNNWKDRLTVIANSQKRAIETWIDSQTNNLNEIAVNPLVQIYLTLNNHSDNENADALKGQEGHLKNLLNATANRAGVFAQSKINKQSTTQDLREGMAVLDDQGRVLLATDNFPQEDIQISYAFAKATMSGLVTIHGVYPDNSHEPRLIIIQPVSAVQALPGQQGLTGAVIAIINPESSLYKILSQNLLTTHSDESLLVVNESDGIKYISPLAQPYSIFHHEPENDAPSLFDLIGVVDKVAATNDYRNIRVVATARNINNTLWTMIQKIDVEEAFRESKAHQDSVLTVFLLAVFIVALMFIAIWRHSTSLRLQRLSERLAARTLLLNSVSSSIRDHIFLLDSDSKIIFINDALLSCLQLSQKTVLGKLLSEVLEPAASTDLLKMKQGDQGDDIRNRVMRLPIAGIEFVYHVSVVCLKQGEHKDSTLYVLHDVTYATEVQNRHNRLMEGIISTLVRVTDMHDPHCANHSERTREVTQAIAEMMGLSENKVNMLAMASLLANIGKLYLPREMLVKMEPLTDEEAQKLRDNILDTVAILKGLEFEGPVITYIEQKNEHLDGSGYPAGLKGEEILLESRILSVANAFVAMSSARAYRPGKPIEEVLNILSQQSDKQYDHQIVNTLARVAENRPDWKDWQNVQ